MVSEYERVRQENIEKNKELLASLGLDQPLFEPKEKRIKISRKRKAVETVNEDERPPAKLQRSSSDTLVSSPVPDGGLRRSSRNAGKVIDYSKELADKPLRYAARAIGLENEGPLREGGRRIHNPKTYGHIPGIEVGTWWQRRDACSADAVHAPWVGGISGGPKGAYSVALSGGYDDDVDLGYAFTYTGSGGRDLRGTKDKPKNLRTAPQSSDQTFEKFNKMLLQSCETTNPVRVIRGFKLKSKYAPFEGFRYDGLYRVEKAWQEKGNNPKGYLVCKFAFKRLPGQSPLPVRDDTDEGLEANEIESEEDEKSDVREYSEDENEDNKVEVSKMAEDENPVEDVQAGQ